MGIFGASLIPSGVVNALMPGDAPPVQPQAPVYKRPSTAQMVVGSIGDALQEWGGGHATFAPEMAARRQAALQQQGALLKQAQDWSNWKRQYDYRLNNQPPAAPHYFQSNNGDEMVIGSDGQPKTLYSDPTPRMQFIPDGMGGGTWHAIPGTGQAKQAPSQPVGKLTPIPEGGAGTMGAPRTFPLR